MYFAEQALKELHAGRTKTWSDFKVPDEAIGCGFHEAVRGVLSHHVVIKNGKIANYHPYPPTPWNANPRDSYGTPGPYEDAVQNTPIFEENGRDKFKGIDIMRAVRSFDPCLPCGVHMYDGGGKILETRHSPMFGSRVAKGRSMPGHTGVPAAARIDRGVASADRIGRRSACAEHGAGVGADSSWICTAPGWSGCWRSWSRRALPGKVLIESLGRDELVSSLLVLYGLHPLSWRTRWRRRWRRSGRA